MKFISVIISILGLAFINLVLSQEPLSSEEDFNDESLLKRGVLEKIGMCFQQNDCLPTEYCNNRKSFFGRCVRKQVDGEFCTLHTECFSRHCHWGRCKGGPKINNVEKGRRCEKTDDCHHEQYCAKKKCADRIVKGWCSDDDHCISGHCEFFRCEPVVNLQSYNNFYNQNKGQT